MGCKGRGLGFLGLGLRTYVGFLGVLEFGVQGLGGTFGALGS